VQFAVLSRSSRRRAGGGDESAVATSGGQRGEFMLLLSVFVLLSLSYRPPRLWCVLFSVLAVLLCYSTRQREQVAQKTQTCLFVVLLWHKGSMIVQHRGFELDSASAVLTRHQASLRKQVIWQISN
jgi:hypothetical protein